MGSLIIFFQVKGSGFLRYIIIWYLVYSKHKSSFIMNQYSANRNMMQTSSSSSSTQKSESSSFNSSVNRSSTTASNARYNMEDSRNISRGGDDSRYYVEDGYQPRYGDENGRNLEIESLPDERALAPPAQPPTQERAQPPPQV